MTYLEKAVIRRAHPKQIIVGIVGFLWFMYFLWLHDWIWALGVGFLSVIVGWILTSGTNEEHLAKTLFGKIMLLHLHPMNVAAQLAGFLTLLYGVWLHAVVYVLVGVSLVFMGHLWGWHKVSQAL
jgi:hypothetical protein